MSKPRKTPVPLPGVKTKTPIPLSNSKKTQVPLPNARTKTPAPPSSSKKTPVPPPSSKKKDISAGSLSQEFVGDSDDSSNEDATRPGTTHEKSTINIAVHRPKTNGVAGQAAEAKKKQKDTVKNTTKENVDPKKPVPKRVVAADDGADSSSSSEESSDNAETDIQQAQYREVQRKQKDSSESSSDDSGDESEDTAVAQRALARQGRPAQSQSHTVAFQQARQYVPPKDFQPISTQHAASSPSINMFEDLKGKQIWHITAPEDVSLSGLSQLAMDKAREGVTVLDHKGKSYGLSSTESTKSEREVLIPSSNGYKSVPVRVSRTFHVQQVINLPRLSSKQADQDTGSAAAASITASTIRAVKPQRKGLKMRFFPSGFEGSAPTTLGTSDSEDDGSIPEPAGLGIPKGLDLPAKKEKRKHEQANGEEGIESPTKKHKKHRTAEEQHKRDEKKAKKERKKEKGAAKAKS